VLTVFHPMPRFPGAFRMSAAHPPPQEPMGAVGPHVSASAIVQSIAVHYPPKRLLFLVGLG
jgi:hypothetical protein